MPFLGNARATLRYKNPPKFAPNDLVLVASADDQIDLSWDDNVKDEDGYSIERSTTGIGAWTELDLVGPSETTYSDTGLTAATNYYYRVRAYNTGGFGPYCNMEVAAPNTLVNSLVSVWTFDEASGNLLDQFGSNDLTDNNSVGSTAGLVANLAREFNGSSHYFSKADNADLSMGDIDFEFVVRFCLNHVSGIQYIYSKRESGTGDEYVLLYNNSTSRFRFSVWNPSDTGFGINADQLGVAGIDRWYTIRCWHDATANEIGIQVDNLTADTIAVTNGVKDSDNVLRVGRFDTTYFDGAIDFLALWKRRLTSDEWVDIQDNGRGLWYGGPTKFGGLPLADMAPEILVNAMQRAQHNVVGFRTPISSMDVGGTVYQANTVWSEHGTPRLFVDVRDITTSSWSQLDTGITLADQTDIHEVTSLGIDPDGYVHLAYTMHVDPLNYATSDQVLGTWAGAVTTGLSMLGTNETEVTYPCFFNDPSGKLYFTFRDGGAGNGDQYIYEYNEGTTTWSALTGTTAGKLIDGKNESPTTQNPYCCFAPRFDSDFGSGGNMHFAFGWAEYLGGANPVDSHDVTYVAWNGTNWTQADGSAQTIPITQANAEIISAVAKSGSTSTGLIAHSTQVDSDSDGAPHVLYLIVDDATSIREQYYMYYRGGKWSSPQLVFSHGGWAQGRFSIRRSDNMAFIWGIKGEDVWNPYYYYSSDFRTWTRGVLGSSNPFGTIYYDRQHFEADSSEIHLFHCAIRGSDNDRFTRAGHRTRLQAYTLP